MINSFKKKSIFFMILIGLIPLLSGVLVSIFFAVGRLDTGYLMWMITAITTALIISIGIPLIRIIGRPIGEVSALCQEIVSGDLPTKVEISCKDEIGAVAESLNEIAGFLHDTKIKLDISERKYQSLMEGANDAIVLLDSSNGQIIKSNKKCQELTGYRENELARMKFSDLHPEAEAKQLNNFIPKLKERGRLSLDDLVLVKKNGARAWVDTSSSYIKYGHSGVIQSIFRDNTERKKKFVLTEKEISFIHEMSRVLPMFQDFNKVMDKILNKLAETLHFNAFVLVISENETTKALIYVSNNKKKKFLNNIRKIAGEVLSEINDVNDKHVLEFEVRARKYIQSAEEEAVGSQIMLPLSIADGMAGLFSDKSEAFNKEDISLFSTLVSGISSIYIAYKAYCQVQELSVTDHLTSLFNRRKFFGELEREVERSNRYRSKLSLIMLDIDHFKDINDRYGHQAGDVVLRHLAKTLLTNTRKTDVAARYGGEEFIIMLTETGMAGALDVAKRINKQVELQEVKTAVGLVKFTVSLGLAEHEKGDGADSLLSRADSALYQAKNNGRNRVEYLISA